MSASERSGGASVGPDAWEYDVLAAAESGGYGLKGIAFEIFHGEGLVDAFAIPHARFKSLLARIELLYSVENPYHCALHAADVLSATHCLRKALPDVFSAVETLALYLAALGHDAGHFRLNNAFLKNSKHTLAKKYPESVLENFHLGLVFELLDDPDVGIVPFLPATDLARFRALLSALILATDMSKHMGLFKELQRWVGENDGARDGDGDDDDDSRAGTPYDTLNDAIEASDAANDLLRVPHKNGHGGGDIPQISGARDGSNENDHEPWVRPALERASEKDRLVVMQLLLKCADLANVVRPLEIADAWGKRIMEEFYQQGEKELSLGLPLTTFPNRRNFDYVFARHQLGFLVNVDRPLFEVFTRLTSFDAREAVLASAAENGDAWTLRESQNQPGRKEAAGRPSTAPTAISKSPSSSSSTSTSRGAFGALARQNTITMMRAFKQSNLTMLTANAMEMTGLDVALDEVRSTHWSPYDRVRVVNADP